MPSLPCPPRAASRTLHLDAPLRYDHLATTYTNTTTALDMRSEVALLDSNLVVTSPDWAAQYGTGGELFGARIVAAGASIVRLSGISVEFCGANGLGRACVEFRGLLPFANTSLLNTTYNVTSGNPSYFTGSSVYRGMDSALSLLPTSGSVSAAAQLGARVVGNALFGSIDTSTVLVQSMNNTVTANLAFGTTKVRWLALLGGQSGRLGKQQVHEHQHRWDSSSSSSMRPTTWRGLMGEQGGG